MTTDWKAGDVAYVATMVDGALVLDSQPVAQPGLAVLTLAFPVRTDYGLASCFTVGGQAIEHLQLTPLVAVQHLAARLRADIEATERRLAKQREELKGVEEEVTRMEGEDGR